MNYKICREQIQEPIRGKATVIRRQTTKASQRKYDKVMLEAKNKLIKWEENAVFSDLNVNLCRADLIRRGF